jgi:acid phosphatase
VASGPRCARRRRKPNFQYHHQPFNYFKQFAPGTKEREEHLRDGGLGDSPISNKFIADAVAGKLPAVTFYKPQGNLNLHAGYSDIESGDAHIANVIEHLKKSPQFKNMLVVITFDENGGWWDHVAPPKGDRWGPGSRIPAIIVSPFAKRPRRPQLLRHHVDHALHHPPARPAAAGRPEDRVTKPSRRATPRRRAT